MIADPISPPQLRCLSILLLPSRHGRRPAIRLAHRRPQKLPPLLAGVFSAILCVPGGLRGRTEVSLQGGVSLATPGGSDVEAADSRAGITVGALALSGPRMPSTTSSYSESDDMKNPAFSIMAGITVPIR